jgi:hypothetical protein
MDNQSDPFFFDVEEDDTEEHLEDEYEPDPYEGGYEDYGEELFED